MFYEGRRHTTTNVSFSFGTWGRSRRIFTCIWHSKQVRINSLKFEKASLPSPPTTTGAAGQREHFNIEMAFRTSVASSRLSDSWDDAKVKGTRKYERVICEKEAVVPPFLSPVPSRSRVRAFSIISKPGTGSYYHGKWEDTQYFLWNMQRNPSFMDNWNKRISHTHSGHRY